MRSWVTFYEGRVFSDDYLQYAAKRYSPFISYIEKLKKDGDRIVEVGCGIATITKLLSQNRERFCGYCCFDLSPDMVELARANLRPYSYPVTVADARLPLLVYPDIVHSHGLLEHFSNDDIWKVLISGWESGARWQVHYVPGNKYTEPSFGDERLMPLSWWVNNFEPTETFSFNDDHDYCLVWDCNKQEKKLKNLLT